MIREYTKEPGHTSGLRVAILLALLVLAAAAVLVSLRRERRRENPEIEEDSIQAGERGPGVPGVKASVALISDDRAPQSGDVLLIRVLDACTGAPVSGARLRVRGDPRVVPEGWAELPEASPGEFVVQREFLSQDELPVIAVARGYQRLRSYLRLESLSAEGVALVKMVPVWGLEAVVLDAVLGRPIGGAPVELHVAAFALMEETFPRSAAAPIRLDRTVQGVTDGQGRIVFDGLPPGSGYGVSIAGDELWQRSEEVAVEIGCEDARVELRAKRGSRIIGQVLDCEGKPGDGFEVSCKRREHDGGHSIRWVGEADVRSGPDGHFELVGLRPGMKLVRLQRKKAGRVEAGVFSAELAPGTTYDCGLVGSVPLGAGGVLLRGAVIDVSGSRVPRAEVYLSSADTAPSGHKYGVIVVFESDEKGAFEVCGLPAERFYLEASAYVEIGKERHFARLWVEPRPGEVLDVLLELKPPEPKLKPGGVLRVDVRLPSGEPADLLAMRPVGASLLGDDGAALAVSKDLGVAGADGTPCVIELRRPAPGEYGVLITAGGFIARLDGCRVEDNETTTYTAVLRPARAVSGRVLGKDTGEPIEARIARRLVERKVPSAEKLAEHWHNVRTGADGRFSAPLFDFGEAGLLSVTARGYKPAIVPVKEGDLDLGDIYLSPDKRF